MLALNELRWSLLTRKLEQESQSSKKLREAVLHTLMVTMEYRDSDTGSHATRVSVIAMKIWKVLGLCSEINAALWIAAALHDIGKIAIPDAILRKNGRLDPDEQKIMEEHSEKWARILESDTLIAKWPIIKYAADVARTHHEKYDGTGYPQWLKGLEISQASRIVSIADVFDALREKRIYKPSVDIDATMDFMHLNSGKMFCPECVEAFDMCLPEIIELDMKK